MNGEGMLQNLDTWQVDNNNQHSIHHFGMNEITNPIAYVHFVMQYPW